MSRVSFIFDYLVMMFILSIVLVYPVKLLLGFQLYPIILTVILIFLLVFLGGAKEAMKPDVIFFILFGCSVLSLIFIFQGGHNVTGLIGSAFYFVFFPMIFLIITKKLSILGYLRIVKTVFILAVICGVFGLIQYMFKFTFIPPPEGISLSEQFFRPISFFSSTQQFAAFMLFAFCVCVVNERSILKSLIVFLFGSVSLSMVFFFGSFVFVFLFLLKHDKFKLVMAIFCAFLSFVLINVYSVNDNRISTVRFLQPLIIIDSSDSSESNSANKERVEIWRETFDLVEFPLYGKDFSLSNPYLNSKPLIAESYFLSLYVNGGVLLILLSFVFMIFIAYQSRSLNGLILMFMYVFVGLFVHVLYAISLAWFFIFLFRRRQHEVFFNFGYCK